MATARNLPIEKVFYWINRARQWICKNNQGYWYKNMARMKVWSQKQDFMDGIKDL